jgi:inosine/xanthosine triphosphatase
MTRVIVASENPAKVRAAEDGFRLVFPGAPLHVLGLDGIPSGVAEQPMSDDETLRGAANRARRARERQPDADFWVGMEGGVHPSTDGQLDAFAWIVIIDRHGASGQSRTATFPLPPAVARLVHAGVELGHANDRVFSETDSKRRGGAVGSLTRGLIDRPAYYAHAVVLALIPFTNPALYPSASI